MLTYLIVLIILGALMVSLTGWAAYRTWCCRSWEDAYLMPTIMPFWFAYAVLWIAFLSIR